MLGWKGKIFFNVFFVVCFAVYAVSPLAATFQCASLAGSRVEPGLRLYVVHYLLSGMLSQDDDRAAAADDDPPGDHIPIKKKRGLLSSQSVKIGMALSTESTSSDAILNNNPISVRINTQSTPNYSPDLFQRLHSGNAPPAA